MSLRRLTAGKIAPLTAGARTFRVRVDYRAVAKHLAREERRHIDEAEVIQLLMDGGFRRAGGESENQWIVREADLGILQPSEVLSIDPVDGDTQPGSTHTPKQ